MRLREIQKKANGLGIRASRMRKVDLIRAIQSQEKNIPCFGTDRITHCGEKSCLWREDCVSMNENSSQGS